MKLALIGHPISHSKSPLLFKELRPKWQYDLIETPDFQEAINIFKSSYDAINVTAPFKEEAFKIADKHDPLCAKTGATNLLVKEKGIIKAYNTDVYGVSECLKKSIEKYHKTYCQTLEKVIIIGCGGSGKAAAIASIEMGLPTTIINRNEQKAIELKNHIPEINISQISEIKEAIKENNIIIYTLPISITELETIDFSKKIIIEANYQSPVLSDHISKLYIGGEFWLRKQAEAAAEIISCLGIT